MPYMPCVCTPPPPPPHKQCCDYCPQFRWPQSAQISISGFQWCPGPHDPCLNINNFNATIPVWRGVCFNNDCSKTVTPTTGCQNEATWSNLWYLDMTRQYLPTDPQYPGCQPIFHAPQEAIALLSCGALFHNASDTTPYAFRVHVGITPNGLQTTCGAVVCGYDLNGNRTPCQATFYGGCFPVAWNSIGPNFVDIPCGGTFSFTGQYKMTSVYTPCSQNPSSIDDSNVIATLTM